MLINWPKFGCLSNWSTILVLKSKIITFLLLPDGVELDEGLEGIDQLRVVPVGGFCPVTENHNHQPLYHHHRHRPHQDKE